jgi:dTDP-4-dehydrorhamnose reductase
MTIICTSATSQLGHAVMRGIAKMKSEDEVCLGLSHHGSEEYSKYVERLDINDVPAVSAFLSKQFPDTVVLIPGEDEHTGKLEQG